MLRIFCGHEALKEATGSPLPNPSSELVILFGLLDSAPNEKRYEGVVEFCKKHIEYVSSFNEPFDIACLPYKFKGPFDQSMIDLSIALNKRGKRLLCFYNDDNDREMNLPSNIDLYRTSLYKSNRNENVYAMPAFCEDAYDSTIISYVYASGKLQTDVSIGYCGHLMNNRQQYLDHLNKVCKTDFIYRRSFRAQEMNFSEARKEFNENIRRNLFTFCFRGAGNFSYRFYETLMMGRIPLLVDTDCVFPFEDSYDLKEHCFYIQEKDFFENFDSQFSEYIKTHYLARIERKNRQLWEDKFSPIGFIKNIIEKYN